MTHTSAPLTALEQRDDFIRRHIGPGESEQQAMLATLGLDSLDALADAVVPDSIRQRQPLDLGQPSSEAEVLAQLRALAQNNQVFQSWIGQGYYNTYTPPVILRNVLENPGWYTAYTPYQPEISQGRLEALLNFQTMVADLTGLALANASLLDEATAAAEAMTLCRRSSKSKSPCFFVAHDVFPQTLDVIRTRAEPLGIEVMVGDPLTDLADVDVFGVLLQYPNSDGAIHDYREVIAQVHATKGLVVMAADLLALTLLTPPGELGADVAVGNTQRFGVPLGFGGPHAAYFATKEAYKRAMPGRLIGVSQDTHGQPAYRLALQTREQHIRRDKATSNICTAQSLLAVMASMYAVYHGPEGLRTIAQRTHRLTAILAAGLHQLDVPVVHDSYFDTLLLATGERTEVIHQAARAQRVNLRHVDAQHIGVSLDETATAADVEQLWSLLSEREDHGLSVAVLDTAVPEQLPEALRRHSAYLTHPVFNRYRSETEMLRYLRQLMDKDLALDRAMIPLGSCTMKLNASAEMLPITWPEFGQIHPFAPAEQTQGYKKLIDDLERMLCACTGYAAVSLQPNSGAQGEYAGLLAIRAWHHSRGDHHRDVCLIPSSAHGTNPASAMMAGMRVVVVACDKQGNVDIEDLRAKAEQYRQRLAALMVTYPSTHGVFEATISDICALIHDYGGQVYLDGANLNAQVGLCAPGHYGADVSHLNLHKTFCIPHGGGGPGVGPIGVGAHLAPFMPGHRYLNSAERPVGPVTAAPWGSAGILPISWAYIALMGAEGLRRASLVAILNANYIAQRLSSHYSVLYTDANGRVAHECILDVRPFKDSAGVSVDDIAKRLIDYGFHAPTMSWPVAGTLMIEPTESESQAELDRFCDAMLAIREEIRAIEQGRMDSEDNPLRNAPHTAEELAADWHHPYSRAQAAYPVASLRQAKYWSPVGRVDNVYGDRHLVCSCPPLSAYEPLS
jgi:glycine dehydrogenase